MKVAYLTHSLDLKTGVGMFSGTLIEGLRSLGVTPEILTSGDALPPSKGKLLSRLFVIRRILSRVDLVHALDGFPYGVIAMLALFGSSKPYLITAVGTGALQKLRHPFYGLLLRRSYLKAVGVTAPSRYVARELERLVPGLVVRVINHGVDYGYWSQGVRNPVQNPYIVSVGAMKRRKGHHHALQAFAEVAKTHKTVRLVIVANPAQSPLYATELKDQIETLGLSDRVEFVWGVDRESLRSLYTNADFFMLLPEVSGGDVEGFGLVFLEAAAAGLPSIATSGTGADDAILEGESGYLIPPHNDEKLCATMLAILENPAKRQQLSKGAQAFAQRMDWKGKIQEYFKLYEELQG